MKLHIHNGFRDPQIIEATRILVMDAYDNPVALAAEIDNGVIIAETAANTAQFNAILRGLGIDKTVIVHNVSQKPLPEIHIPGT